MTDEATLRGLAVWASILCALGVVIGVANNLAAGPERRIEWIAEYPAVPVRDCAAEAAARGAGEPGPAEGTGPSIPAAAGADPGPAGIPSIPEGSLYGEIGGEAAGALREQGAYFVDARASASYREAHVAGAKSIPAWEAGVEQKIEEISWDVPGKDFPLVIYCSGGDCTDSHMLAEKVAAAGYTRVYVYKEGFPDWQGRGLPVTSGDAP